MIEKAINSLQSSLHIIKNAESKKTDCSLVRRPAQTVLIFLTRVLVFLVRQKKNGCLLLSVVYKILRFCVTVINDDLINFIFFIICCYYLLLFIYYHCLFVAVNFLAICYDGLSRYI